VVTDALVALETAFHRAHEHRYGHATAREAEIVSFRLTAIGSVPKPTPPRWMSFDRHGRSSPMDEGPLAQAQRAERDVVFGGDRRRAPVYRRERLPAGAPVVGPAVLEEMGSTTIVPPGWQGTVGVWGELTLERRSL
jgi:N-methylhydantoinase A